MWQLRAIDSGQEWLIPLDGDKVEIGRHHNCNIVLRDPTVSRYHCTLQREGEGYILLASNKSNLPIVNDKTVEERYTLHPSDIIQLGRTKLYVLKQETHEHESGKLYSFQKLRNVALISLMAKYRLMTGRLINHSLASFEDDKDFSEIFINKEQWDLDTFNDLIVQEKGRLQEFIRRPTQGSWSWKKLMAIIIVRGGSYFLLLFAFLVLLWVMENIVNIYNIKHMIFGK